MKIGPYTITRGEILPYEEDATTDQVRKVAVDQSLVVVDRPVVLFKKAKIRVPRDEATKIERFLTRGSRFAGVPFTLEDGYGTAWTVNFWDRRVRKKTIAADYVEMILTFRVAPVNR